MQALPPARPGPFGQKGHRRDFKISSSKKGQRKIDQSQPGSDDENNLMVKTLKRQDEVTQRLKKKLILNLLLKI